MNLEICDNAEWWRVFSSLDLSEIVDEFQDDASKIYRQNLIIALESAGHLVTCARGQRMMCHGWNGANTFTRKGSGLGTFDHVTDSEWATVQTICDHVAMAWATEIEHNYPEWLVN